MEERYSRRPTIITTNLDYPEWVNDLLPAHSGLELTSQFRIQAWTLLKSTTGSILTSGEAEAEAVRAWMGRSATASGSGEQV